MRKLLRDVVRRGLRPLESLVLLRKRDLPFPPIFIVSPPRSGSTLCYLLATQKFHLSYFSNFTMTCPDSPAFLTLIGARFGACAGSGSLDNQLGETYGWRAPNQGYRAWNRWFPSDRDYLRPDEVTSSCRREVRQTLGAIERATRSPFINKWQRNTPRIQALQAVFPEALFLHLRRDPILTVQSILSVSERVVAGGGGWFSAMPRSYADEADKSSLRKTAEQVALLEMDLEQDKKQVGEDRFFDLNFRDLCRDADTALNTFSSWYTSRTGIHLKPRRELRAELHENSTIRMSEDDVAMIKGIFKDLGFDH
jgi:hypothetical protein